MDKPNPAFVNTTSSTLLPQYSATPPPINPSTLSWIQTCQIKSGHPIAPEKQDVPQEPTKDTFSHLQSGNDLPNQAKIERRQIEELIRTRQMHYDPIWCMWRPNSKQEFALSVNQLYEQAIREQNEGLDRDLEDFKEAMWETTEQLTTA